MNKGMSGFWGHAATVAGFVVWFLALAIFILMRAGALPTPGKKYEITAEVPNVNLLAPGARVTAGGAEVGRVKSVDRAGKLSPNTKITMYLTDASVYPVPSDTRVQIRTRSQVGENYVGLVIGEAKTTVPDGGDIALANADEVVSVDQILSVLQGRTRQRTRTLLKQFGGALEGRGEDLNATLSATAKWADTGTETVTTLSEDRQQLGLLVDQLGRVMSALGDRRAAIDTIAAQGTRSLTAIGDRDAKVAEMLRELPSTLDAIKAASTTLGDVGDRATPVITNLAAATRDLRPAIAALAPSASSGRRLVASLDQATEDADTFLSAFPTITAVDSVADADNAPERGVRLATGPLRDTFCEANPALRYLKPYTSDIYQVILHLGSGANSYDATGHLVRLTPILNENSLSGAPESVTDAARTLLSAGALIPSKRITYDPYMAPGVIGKTVADAGDAVNMTDYSKKYKYTRVKAQC
jgi:phospholipid/cholesterol/gamma-HCH transport system substrate-binding protein